MRSAAANGSRGRRLQLSHPADPSRLHLLRSQVGRWAQEHSVPEQTVIDLQLVLGEAVSNGVEHAYRDRSAGIVEVQLELQDAGGEAVVAVCVVDHGRWRPIPILKNGRGRGLAIIDQLSRGLQIAASAHGTRLTCLVPVRG